MAFCMMTTGTILAANVDVSVVDPTASAADHRAFNHFVRIVLENQPIFAGAGFALIAVQSTYFGLADCFGTTDHFISPPRAEARAAAPRSPSS